MSLPELGVGNLDHAAPEIRLGQMLFPIAEILRVERRKFRRQPSLGMNTIGDAGNGHLMDRNARPNIFPKRLTDFSVQFAHPIGMPARAQSKDGHAKGADSFAALKQLQAPLIQAEMTTAYAIMFGICATAYIIAWVVMKILVPKFKKVVL